MTRGQYGTSVGGEDLASDLGKLFYTALGVGVIGLTIHHFREPLRAGLTREKIKAALTKKRRLF